MKEEKRKEILTKEIIEKDFKRKYKNQIITYSYVFIGFFIFWCITIPMVEFKFEFKNIFCNTCSLLLLIGDIVFLYLLLRNIYEYKQKKYIVVTEQYLGLTTIQVGFDINYCLKFYKYGKFRIDYMGEYYPSSQHYKMNMDRLIETSTPGDKFYLVICSNKIIQVYNTKFFEINDNTYAPNSTKFI